MSVIPLKADIHQRGLHVRLVRGRDITEPSVFAEHISNLPRQETSETGREPRTTVHLYVAALAAVIHKEPGARISIAFAG
jgi:hypothetical protein